MIGPSAPHLAGRLHHKFEFAALVVRRQGVARNGAGKAALGAEREALDRNIFCGLADAAFELLFAFELRLLGRDEPENSNLAARQVAQRCEAAGAR